MPTSYFDFKIEIKNYIYNKYDKNIRILDIGPGQGTYAMLLNDYKNIDCVEVYEPYVERFNLNNLYNNVFVSNILDFNFEYYDVIILGDILEHIESDIAVELINKLFNKCDELIVSVPYLADFNYLYDDEPNKNELHIQVDLTEDVMKQRYPMLMMLWSNEYIGVFVKNKSEYNENKDLAITVYIDDNQNIIEEFSWLYKSFIFSENYLNSDIVAFCHPNVFYKLDKKILNDKNVRLISYKPISEKEERWSNYKFINSIEYLNTDNDILLKYKYLLSTDCDVFLTENLKDLRPNKMHLFGLGDYMNTKLEIDKVVEVINKIGFKYNFIHNVGTTYLFKSKDVIDFRRLQYKVCEYLLENEFKEEGKWGTWYKGIMTMYAGEIVANQLSKQTLRTCVFDSISMTNGHISNEIYHIHAWHTYEYFSKFNYRKGEYKDINVDELDLDLVPNYCLFICEKSIDEIYKIKEYNK